MNVYRFNSKGVNPHTAEWIVDTSGTLEAALEEFRRTYGLSNLPPIDTDRYQRMIANTRVSLFRDRQRLKLTCNPLIDDLNIVFADWLLQKPGFRKVNEEKLRGEVSVRDFKFPY